MPTPPILTLALVVFTIMGFTSNVWTFAQSMLTQGISLAAAPITLGLAGMNTLSGLLGGTSGILTFLFA